MTGCCASGCKNRSENGYKLYGIPQGKNDQERRKNWLSIMNRQNFVPSRNARLCEEHFKATEFEKNNPRKLKPNAIPTMFSNLPQFKRKQHKFLLKRSSKVLGAIENLNCPDAVSLDHSYNVADTVCDVGVSALILDGATENLNFPDAVSLDHSYNIADAVCDEGISALVLDDLPSLPASVSSIFKPLLPIHVHPQPLHDEVRPAEFTSICDPMAPDDPIPTICIPVDLVPASNPSTSILKPTQPENVHVSPTTDSDNMAKFSPDFIILETQTEDSPVIAICDDVTRLKRYVESLRHAVSKLKKDIEAIEDNMKAFLNPDQIQALRKKKGGSIWSEETVKKALHLRFACGYTGYQTLLEQGYPLPSDRTLRRKLQNVTFTSGVLDEIFFMLANKVNGMTEQERKVSLSLDEMAIQPSLDFDCRSGSILGFPTIPESFSKIELKTEDEGNDNLATHALVFMIRGLSTPWKQAVAYEYTGNSFSAIAVKDKILQIITKSHSIGLDIKNVTMDMGGGNQGILREFGIRCGRVGDISHSIVHPMKDNCSLYFFNDFPHLLKNFRNHLSRGQDIFLPTNVVEKNNLPCNVVSLACVEQLLTLDERHNLKLSPRLKRGHLRPGHFEKMKVAPAQILISRQTAAALRILVDRKLIENNALTTAWFFEQMSSWYDLVTSRSNKTAFSHFTEEKFQGAHTYLLEFIELIRNINIGSPNAPWKPVQKGIVISTTSALQVKDDMLNTDGFLFVCMSGFTQDCTENLFSVVRYRNPVPTALEFKNALRIICLTQLLKGNGRGNYKLDQCVEISTVELGSVIDKKNQIEALSGINMNSEFQLSEIESLSLYNLAGYCVKQFTKYNKNCDLCSSHLVTKERPSLTDLTTEQCYTVNALTYASMHVFSLLEIAERTILDLGKEILKSTLVIPRLMKEAMIRTEVLEFPNCHAAKEKLLHRFFKVRVFSFLTDEKANLKAKQKNKLKKQAEGSRSMSMRESVKNKH